MGLAGTHSPLPKQLIMMGETQVAHIIIRSAARTCEVKEYKNTGVGEKCVKSSIYTP